MGDFGEGAIPKARRTQGAAERAYSECKLIARIDDPCLFRDLLFVTPF